MIAKRVIAITSVLVATHIALLVITLHVEPPPATISWLAYHSYFTIAKLFQWLGIPAIGPFKEGMFIAPVTVTGKSAIAAFWLTLYFLAAYIGTRATSSRKANAPPQP